MKSLPRFSDGSDGTSHSSFSPEEWTPCSRRLRPGQNHRPRDTDELSSSTSPIYSQPGIVCRKKKLLLKGLKRKLHRGKQLDNAYIE